MKERRKHEKKSVNEVLSDQLRKLLTQSGIRNLHVEDDGTLSGETNRITHYPMTHRLKRIRLEIVNGILKINADITESSENTGSVI